MIIINSHNLLEFVGSYYSSIGCDPVEVNDYFTATRFSEGVVLNLPAVCLLQENKPKTSRSKQSHIHVTSQARLIFFSSTELDSATRSTHWERQDLNISDANVSHLHNIPHSKDIAISGAYMMKKIGYRQSQETQVQISKIADDDSRFLALRKGLYENDIIVFLKYRDENRLLATGIPKRYFDGTYSFAGPRAVFRSGYYPDLESNMALPVKQALKNVLDEYDNGGVIAGEEPISDAIYQCQVDAATPSKTDYTANGYYVDDNPEGKAVKSNRPTTNPSIGKEAIQDGHYKCAIDGGHTTFAKRDGSQYMEAHHLVPMDKQRLYKYKLDTKANIVPLCPNCHRMLHYGKFVDIEPILSKLYNDRKDILFLSGIDVTEDQLKSYYR